MSKELLIIDFLKTIADDDHTLDRQLQQAERMAEKIESRFPFKDHKTCAEIDAPAESFDDEAERLTEKLLKKFPPHHDPEAPANIWNPRGKVVEKSAPAKSKPQAPASDLTTKQQEALEVLEALIANDGETTIKGLAEALEKSPAAAKYLMDELIAKGRVTFFRDGRTFVYRPKAAA